MAKPIDCRVVSSRILGVLGFASLVASCTARQTEGESEGADEAESTSMASETSGMASETSDEDSSSETSGMILDVPPADSGDSDDDPHELECMVFDFLSYTEERAVTFEVLPECMSGLEGGYDKVCVWPTEGSSCEDFPVPDYCVIEAYECALAQIGNSISCGPTETPEGACCYVVVGDCPVGRPFLVAGRARVAERSQAADWALTQAPELCMLDAATRAALADAYAREGLTEHASVASFARFTLHLQRLAAPPELIAASLRAAADEVRHAQRCFGLASAYAGEPCGPSALDVRGCLDADASDLESIASSLAREGCIAETVSTLLLAAARDRASDPAVRACLSEIVEDELEHVLLAWEALAWLVREHPQLRGPLARVFAEAERHVGFGSITELPGDPASMRAHGYLAIAERRAIARDVLARVIRPAVAGLQLVTPSELMNYGIGGTS